jgi:hypothetical protein
MPPSTSALAQTQTRVRPDLKIVLEPKLTLVPERNDLGLQPIVVARFPFLIGRDEDSVARYRDQYPHQVNYISRRHARFFLRDGLPFVEDMGSTNGTFIGGERLGAHPAPLHTGDIVGFGGMHFMYRVSVETKAPPAVPIAAAASAGHDKTMFVAAGASFLDIFCGGEAQQPQHESPEKSAKGIVESTQEKERPRQRGRFAFFLSELLEAFAGGERGRLRHPLWWTASLVAALGAVALVIYLGGTSERQVRDLFASGEYAGAATAANQYLEQHPENAEIKALSTEALLKANVPGWLAMLRQRDFDRASGALARMREQSGRNENVKSWVGDLEWLTDLERFVLGRGGVDAPVRIYVDEAKIRALLKYWNDDTQSHQRTFATIASYVPEFKDAYAEALSHLRKLQSDDSLYLTAIERLNSSINAELNRDTPDALETLLKEYSEKYPRLGGLDSVREDLRQYLAIEEKLRARRLGPLITLRARMRFSTPPFQSKFRTLISSDRFPPADLVQRYEGVSQAWREGDGKRALAALQGMRTGPWSDAAALEQEHKRAIIEQYTALQSSRNANGYEDRLMSLYGALDPDEDEYFIRSTKAEVDLHKDKVVARANDAANRADAMWHRYRENGAITGRQRLEGEISSQFRMQARLLSEAERNARQAIRTYAQLKLGHPAQWSKVQEEINAEAEMQRKALLDLRKVLEPRLFKAKLSLLEGSSDD